MSFFTSAFRDYGTFTGRNRNPINYRDDDDFSLDDYQNVYADMFLNLDDVSMVLVHDHSDYVYLHLDGSKTSHVTLERNIESGPIVQFFVDSELSFFNGHVSAEGNVTAGGHVPSVYNVVDGKRVVDKTQAPELDVSLILYSGGGAPVKRSTKNIISSNEDSSNISYSPDYIYLHLDGKSTSHVTLEKNDKQPIPEFTVNVDLADFSGKIIAESDITTDKGNVIIGTSGKGIDFSATNNSTGTMTSELLNDYEEGTWTPTLTSSSSILPWSVTNLTAKYTKIGRVVYVYGSAILTSAPANALIANLPYPNGNTIAGPVMFNAFNPNPLTYIDANSSFIALGNAASINTSPPFQFVFSAWYFV